MKKVLALLLSMFMVLGLAAGCTKEDPPVTDPGTTDATDPGTTDATDTETTGSGLSGSLNFWSFSPELEVMAIAFRKDNPDVTINYTMIPDTEDQFKNSLLNAISGGNVPDAVGLEAAFVREFVENGSMMTINEFRPLAEAMEQYEYMLNIGTDPNGDLKAVSFQATPGGMFYRRSLATEFFGTEEPEDIQELVKDMDAFVATAAVVHEKSGGSAFMVPSFQDFCNPFFNTRSQPWIVDNKLYIDPVALELFDLSKQFRDNAWEARAQAWSPEWNSAMSDDLTDINGNKIQVFTYFLPTWGLPYVLMNNSGGNTDGDWGLVDGPFEYAWGGSFLGIMDRATNVELAKEFVKFCTLDEENLKNWALGTYTNEYLKTIDGSIADSISQGAGDLVNSKRLVAELTPSFDDAGTSAFLGGQNSYAKFGMIAAHTHIDLIQRTDGTIQALYINSVGNYVNGDQTQEEALADFERNVQEALPDLDW
ncbi:MAG: extracellular solute-binding protein [Oscillospiraceae bacterium]|nr:extracellular solute-binding protein [Oscillospiraceae bacterium]